MHRALSTAALLISLAAFQAATAQPAPDATSESSATAELVFDRPCQMVPDSSQSATASKESKTVLPHSDPKYPLQQPDYPADARHRGAAGTVGLLLLVNEEGFVVRARVSDPSQFVDLDQAALAVTEHWRFKPGAVDSKPYCGWGKFMVTFTLTDAEDDTEEALDPAAERLASQMLDSDWLTNSFVRMSAEVKDRPGAAEVGRLLARDFGSDVEIQRARRALARRLVRDLSAEQLAQVQAFYSTEAGRKWIEASREILMVSSIYVQSFIAARSCATVALTQALSEGKQQRALTTTELPQEFIDSVPRLMTAVKPMCSCAAREFVKQRIDQTASGSAAQPWENLNLRSCETLKPNLKW